MSAVAKPKIAYSLEEAAAATGLSTKTLRRAHNDGLLPFRYVTSKPVIKAADLDALLDNAATDRTQLRSAS